MSDEEATPLQIAVRRAIADSGRAREFFDTQLRERLNTKGKVLYDIDRGKSKRPAVETLQAAEQVMGLPAGQLVSIAYPSLLAGKEPDQPVARSIDGGEVVEITRLDLSLPMGPGATVDDYVEEEPIAFDLGYLRSFTRTPPHRLRLAAGAGDSMLPTLLPNDLVWIDTTQNQLLHADRIYAASINGGAAIKRLRPVAGGSKVLVISDNKTIDAYEVDASDVIIWGRVIRFARDI
ncbi:LexA family transcriptional regulator [Sphingomonas sp. gentR]|uniref:LexA family transcriptional regulator n=1 Tax=Sphingomonas sp. gentR TaxID=3118768 RepID=UPI00177DC45C